MHTHIAQGMDLPDVKVVVQYRATCGLCMLWQRFGRGARGDDVEATGVLLVEKKDTEGARKKKIERATKRAESKMRAATKKANAAAKAKAHAGDKRKRRENAPLTPRKRAALQSAHSSFNQPVHAPSRLREEILSEPVPTAVSPTPSAAAAGDDGLASESDAGAHSESEAGGDESEAGDESDDGKGKVVDNEQSLVGTPKPRASRGQKGKRDGLTAGDPLDLLINPTGEKRCRRGSPKVYFGHWDSNGKRILDFVQRGEHETDHDGSSHAFVS